MDYKNIKFRAWHKQEKKMCEVLALSFNNDKVHLNMQYYTELVYVDHVELMMFTGQQDKHGKDIYEGDIVQTDDGVRIYYSMTSETKYTNTREIIGNTYENPELV